MIDPSLFAIGCGAAAAVLWGGGDFLAAKATRLGNAMGAAASVNAVSAVAFALFYLAANGLTIDLDSTGLLYAVPGGMAMAVGQLTLFAGLHRGPVSLVSPLSSAYPIVTTVGLLLFFGVRIGTGQLIGVGVVMLGVLAASGVFAVGSAERRLSTGVVLALATAGSWGIAYILLSRALEHLDWQTASLVQLIVVATVCAAFYTAIRGDRAVRRDGLRPFSQYYIVAAGIVLMAGAVAVNIGLEHAPASAPVTTAVSACYPVLTVVLALRHLNEDLKIVPLAGALLSIAGVVGLALTQLG